MIELVMVIVITGILAAVALPRMFDSKTFQARGFYDQTLSMLRYAQKVAIAQHASVYVNVAGATICLTYSPDPTCSNSTPLQIVLNPADQSKFSKTAASGITIGTTASQFYFSALGKPMPDAAVTLTINGDIPRTITVEQETGYVH